MGALELIYWILGITALLAQYLLYRANAPRNVYVMNLVIGIILAFIAFTSFPSNYVFQKMVAIVLGLMGFGGMYAESMTDQKIVAKVLLTISILGNFILLLV